MPLRSLGFITPLGVALACLSLLASAKIPRETFYTYVGDVDSHRVLIAWGTASSSGNTIGRASRSHGTASVQLGGRTLVESERNWVLFAGLAPDTEYGYRITIAGQLIGEGQVRTWPVRATSLAFFVIGDYGNGSDAQYRLARAMHAELARRQGSPNPVRFVITTGDNIYGWGYWPFRWNTGNKDQDWRTRFFEPYEEVLRRVPFYPTLGKHDGNGEESRQDLDTYLDNFFFPANRPARHYSFSFGGLADFFALDTTTNTESGPPEPAYRREGEQFRWLAEALPESQAPWKIPYFHNPPFVAGPRRSPIDSIGHFLKLFQAAGVRVAFNGHEHNFQYSADDEATGGIRYVVSGAGGELRAGEVREMQQDHIEGWAPQHHFLLVEIEGPTLSITPLSFEPVRVLDKDRKPIDLPIRIALDRRVVNRR
jgi:tartrate-resistant acid phosphatase type 5